MIKRKRLYGLSPLSAILQAFLGTALCLVLQWCLFPEVEPGREVGIDRWYSVWGAVIAQEAWLPLLAPLAWGLILVLLGRVALNLLLLAPEETPTLYLLGALVLSSSVNLLTLTPIMVALPLCVLSLHALMTHYDAPQHLQTVTVAGWLLGVSALFYPPLLYLYPIGIISCSLLKVWRLRVVVAYTLGIFVALWISLPIIYLLRGFNGLASLGAALIPNTGWLDLAHYWPAWVLWGEGLLLLGIAYLVVAMWGKSGRVESWYRQRVLLMWSMGLLGTAPWLCNGQREAIVMANLLTLVPLAPLLARIPRAKWTYLAPLLWVLAFTSKLLIERVVA